MLRLKKDLESLRFLQKTVSAEISRSNRINLLRKHFVPELEILRYIYSPENRFYVTSYGLRKYLRSPTYNNDSISLENYTLKSLLNSFHERRIGGYRGLEHLRQLVLQYPHHEQIICDIVDKNLRIQLSSSTIDKIYRELRENPLDQSNDEPNLENLNLSKIHVPLAKDIKDLPKLRVEHLFDRETYFFSRKFDGIRSILFFDLETLDIEWRSRSNRKFPKRFTHIEKELTDQLMPESIRSYLKETFKERFIAIDSEICLFMDNHNQHSHDKLEQEFGRVISAVMGDSASELRSNLYLVILDILPASSIIWNNVGTMNFKSRHNVLRNCFGTRKGNGEMDLTPTSSKHIKIAGQMEIHSKQQLDGFIDRFLTGKLRNSVNSKADNSGWEGILLRKNTFFKGKRSWDLIKIKNFIDEEFLVVGIDCGPMWVPGADKSRPLENVLRNLWISRNKRVKPENFFVTYDDATKPNFLGNLFKVGSGINLDTRVNCATNPSLILGKEVCVKYYSEIRGSATKHNDQSGLRFPSVKAIYWEGKRTF